MCANYLPISSIDRLLTYFGVDFNSKASTDEIFSLGESPFIRLSIGGEEGGRPVLAAENGMFGLLPDFATELRGGRKTYNARSETVHKLPSFSNDGCGDFQNRPSSTFWRATLMASRSSAGDLMGHTNVRSEQEAQDIDVARKPTITDNRSWPRLCENPGPRMKPAA